MCRRVAAALLVLLVAACAAPSSAAVPEGSRAASAAATLPQWPAPTSAGRSSATATPPVVRRIDCRRLTLRQRAAQVVMTGIPGTMPTRGARQLVSEHAGSVVLLGHNVSSERQVRHLIHRLRRAAPRRLLVAIDEEGGRVARLGNAGIVDLLPPARTVAQTRTPAETAALGRRLGRQLRDLGVDWDLAPVLDVTDASATSVIGDRSYGATPKRVSTYGRAFARGLRRAGMRTTGKHFPGHGRTSVDSHAELPTVNASRRSLLRNDVRPFAEAARTLDAVMSAHVRYPALDRQRPASLSRAAARLLRREVGFDKVLVTDALEMGAITSRWGIARAAELAVRAGADMALVGTAGDTADVTERLVAAVRAGRLPAERLDAAVGRVLALKGYGQPRIACLTRQKRMR